VDEFQVWIAAVKVWKRAEGGERFPIGILGSFVEATHRAIQGDEVGLSVTSEVHELGMAGKGSVGLGSNEFDRGETGFGVPGAVVADGTRCYQAQRFPC